jgi:hypothetical protein
MYHSVQTSPALTAGKDLRLFTIPDSTWVVAAGHTLKGNVLTNNPIAPRLPQPATIDTLYTTPAFGAFSIEADGSFTYIPDDGFIGTDSFNYRIKSGTLFSEIATATLFVTDRG